MKRKRLAIAVVVLLVCLAPLAAGRAHLLIAHGSHGWIRFWGTGKVHLSGRGTLVIKNRSNLFLKIHGKWGKLKKTADGGNYYHFKGSVDSIGPGAHLEIRGWNLGIRVKGFGKAHFRGAGSYTLDGGEPVQWKDVPGRWTKISFRR